MVTTQQSQDQNLVALQDGLRSIRSFVGGLTGSMNDQSWAGQDSAAYNTPYRYTSVGRNGGVAVEGTSAQILPAGSSTLPTMLMIGAAALAVYLLVK